MKQWVTRVRGALGMGLTWAAGWAIAGVLVGVSTLILPGAPWKAFLEVFDAPLPALAIPGFVGGALFSVVLGIAARRRRFHELSLPTFAAWGAIGGVLLTLVPFALVASGLATPDRETFDTGRVMTAIGGTFVALSSISAVGTLLLARKAERRASLGPAVEASAVAPPALQAAQPLDPMRRSPAPDSRTGSPAARRDPTAP